MDLVQCCDAKSSGCGPRQEMRKANASAGPHRIAGSGSGTAVLACCCRPAGLRGDPLIAGATMPHFRSLHSGPGAQGGHHRQRSGRVRAWGGDGGEAKGRSMWLQRLSLREALLSGQRGAFCCCSTN